MIKDIANGLGIVVLFYLVMVLPATTMALGFLNVLLHPNIVAPLNWLFAHVLLLPLRLVFGYGW